MSNNELEGIIRKLSDTSEFKLLHHQSVSDVPMPSLESLLELMHRIKEVIFPGFYGNSNIRPDTMHYYIGADVDAIRRILAEQVNRGLCFDCLSEDKHCEDCEEQSKEIASRFIEKLPEIKHLLSTDVVAAYIGDPAAKSYGEVIFCYPSISALTHYRVAHVLLKMGVPVIPRIITEISHSETGIDIHPGAEIGEYFFIDHGTGVVIGETSVIGRNVRIYQGVTLGAKSFPLDEHGKPIKGIPRHPVVEDDVIIYSNASILGRVTIGKGSVIGGNRWITTDIPPNSKVVPEKV